MVHPAGIAAAGLAGAALGLLIRHRLAALTYRRASDAHLPKPGPRWWLPVATGVAVAGLVASQGTPEDWPTLMATLPVALSGPWLAAIDLDVRRLPDRLLGPFAGIVTVGILNAAVVIGSPWGLATAAIAGMASLAGFWALHRLSRGGLGFGDVKLAGILGLATGSISLPVWSWSLLIGATGAALWALAKRRPDGYAYGPWLAAGALIGLVIA